MMSNKILLIFITLFIVGCATNKHRSLVVNIENLLSSNKDFNGVILITKKDEVIVSKTQGYSNIEDKALLTFDSQFVIGSISKQITAVLVMIEYEKGNLDLHKPISTYLPKLKQPWANKVTTHHLLIHTHGINRLKEPLEFELGTQFNYSQLGYQILADILQSITHKSFEELATQLLEKHGLNNTFHPGNKAYKNLVNGYTELSDKSIRHETNSLRNYPAAGSFISNAKDLVLWNDLLHNHKLVKATTLKMMQTRYATRNHPIFNQIEYGYGLLFNLDQQAIEIGALGYAPGFVSASYYYPQSKINVVVLQNIARNLNDFTQTFKMHLSLMELVKNYSIKY